MQGSGDPSVREQSPPGVVELREDVPLKASSWAGAGGGRGCGGGPRVVVTCFTALTIAITVALLTQIYYGDFQVVPHGSVSSSGSECSKTGTNMLKAGGRALDAAVAAALCLAVTTPHSTGLDASGTLLVWEYRNWRTKAPELSEWGVSSGQSGTGRLVCALAALHAESGALPWPTVIQPAIHYAKAGFPVSEATASAARWALAQNVSGLDQNLLLAGSTVLQPGVAQHLMALQNYTSEEVISVFCGGVSSLTQSSLEVGLVGAGWKLAAGGSGARVLRDALEAAFSPAVAIGGLDAVDEAIFKASTSLSYAIRSANGSVSSSWEPTGVASALAVIDSTDTYISLVTGLSQWFGSGPEAADGGWRRDLPPAQLDLTPAVMLQDSSCGTRYVIGAESTASLAQAAAALALSPAASPLPGVERARLALLSDGGLATEPPPAPLPPPTLVSMLPAAGAGSPAVTWAAAVNVVQQVGDTLSSHADSRGGGLASRF